MKSLWHEFKSFAADVGLTAAVIWQALRKGIKMSEAAVTAVDAPIPTAPIDAITSFATHPATAATVQAIQAQMPATSNWASVAVSALGALSPYLSPVLQITRASSKTSAEVALGYAALEAILSVFYPHPGAVTQG